MLIYTNLYLLCTLYYPALGTDDQQGSTVHKQAEIEVDTTVIETDGEQTSIIFYTLFYCKHLVCFDRFAC